MTRVVEFSRVDPFIVVVYVINAVCRGYTREATFLYRALQKTLQGFYGRQTKLLQPSLHITFEYDASHYVSKYEMINVCV